jgi:hypothetical protein
LQSDANVVLQHDNKTTVLDGSAVANIFGLIVTLDDLGSIAVSLDAMKRFGVDIDDDAQAVVWSLHTLEQIVRLLDEPWSLLHYLRRRQETYGHVDVTAPEELDVVMYHLAKNLYFDEVPAGSEIGIGPETDPLDEWDNYRRGARSKPVRRPSQQLPKSLHLFLDGLSEHRPAGWTTAAFQILDRDEQSRRLLAKGLRQAAQRCRADGVHHDISADSKATDGATTGISIVVEPPDGDDAQYWSRFLTHLNGLRTNAEWWVGVAATYNDGEFRPRHIEIATPPYEQVVPADEVRMPPTWSGRQRTTIRRRLDL